MVKKLFTLILVFLAPLSVSAEETLAWVQIGRYTLSIVGSGLANLEDCELNLVAEAFDFRRAINLRRSFYNVCRAYSNNGSIISQMQFSFARQEG
jgi:hypothetical protein